MISVCLVCLLDDFIFDDAFVGNLPQIRDTARDGMSDVTQKFRNCQKQPENSLSLDPNGSFVVCCGILVWPVG